jgi:hypothetical protein
MSCKKSHKKGHQQIGDGKKDFTTFVTVYQGFWHVSFFGENLPATCSTDLTSISNSAFFGTLYLPKDV